MSQTAFRGAEDPLISQVREILTAVGFPDNEVCTDDECGPRWLPRIPLVVLTLAGIPPGGQLANAKDWRDGKLQLLRNKQWLQSYNELWGKGDIGSGSYDYFYRCTLRYLIETGMVVQDPDKVRPVNSPGRCYGLTTHAAELLRNWEKGKEAACLKFLESAEADRAAYVAAAHKRSITVKLDGGKQITMEGDGHNLLQQKIVEVFLPHFIKNFEVLYIADTANKRLAYSSERIAQLKLDKLFESELPDIVAFDPERHWIIVVEAFHTAGAITTSRLGRLRVALGDLAKNTVFVTAFDTKADYKRYADAIAWKTEVWIAEDPHNMIHLDGVRFLGPYEED